MQNVMQALYLTRNARSLPASARRYNSRKNQEAQRSKEELSSLEKAKQEYDLWVLAEEYEEYER